MKLDLMIIRIRRSAVLNHLWIYLFAPLAGLTYVQWRFPTWFVNPPFQIDPWIYWGTGENLRYAGDNFSNTYYYRRWTLTLPNHFFQAAFSPLHAQFLLRSLLLLGLLVCIAAILWTATRSLAIVTLIIFAICSNEYLVHLIGRSYNEGTGLLLVTAGVGVLVWSIDRRPQHQALLYGAAGLLFGLAMISYQFTVYIFPSIFLVTSFVRSGSTLMRWLIRYLLLGFCAVCGFAVALLLDLWIGRLLGTPWENLLTYSLRVGSGIRSQNMYSVARDVYLKRIVLDPSSYLVPVGAILIGYAQTLLDVRVRATTQRRVLIRYSVALFVTFFCLPMLPKSANVVGYTNTNVYLLLALYFALAMLIYRVLQYIELSPHASPLGRVFPSSAVFAFLIGAIGIGRLSEVKTTASTLYWTALMVPVCVAVMRRLAVRPEQRTRSLKVVVAASLITASLGILETVESRWAVAQRPGFASREAAGEFLQQLSITTRRLTEIANKQSRRMWLIDTREHSGWSTNISALYGNYSAATLGFPPAEINCDQLSWIVMFSNSTIVVLGETDQAQAKRLIQSLTSHCPPTAMNFRLVDKRSSSVWIDIQR